jgi:anti-sigma-K factor RskA
MYDEAQDALAAEYVLGTLSGDEREHAEALLAIDPGFAESVRLWERRLGELNVMVEAVEPPPAVWEKISAEIAYASPPSASASPLAEDAATIPTAEASPPVAAEAPIVDRPEEPGKEELQAEPSPVGQLPDTVSAAITSSLAKSLAGPSSDLAALAPPPPPEMERSADVVYLARRMKRWRGVAIAAQAVAALLAIYVVAAQFDPALMPILGRPGAQQTAQAPAQLAARLVAVLQQEPTAPAFLLTLDPQSRTVVVRRVSATPEEGRSYELWMISKQYPTPKSLGVVGKDEFTQRQIPGNYDLAMLRAASYAVSLEPQGGSPSGVPTGPVLFTGNIVESVPTTPRT